MSLDPHEELEATLKLPKTWDNSALRLRIGDVEIKHRSVEAELRAAAVDRLEPQRPRRGRREKPLRTEW